MRILVLALAPFQWASVVWYIQVFKRYPGRFVRRLLPWAAMMLVNVGFPIWLFLENAHSQAPDDLVRAAGLVEGAVFLVLLFVGLKRLKS